MGGPSSPEHSLPTAAERLHTYGARVLNDTELVAAVLGATKGANSTEKAAAALLEKGPLAELAWAQPEELEQIPGIGPIRAAALAAAFELGRRTAWTPPLRGERCLDPGRVHELLRHVAHAAVEEFHLVLLDTRGRLIKTVRIAQGSISQCPVSPRDVLKSALLGGAHSVVFVHNHPSGGPGAPVPSPEDVDLTERLRAASELVGLVARDHVIIGSGGYYSFVEAGRWRR